jgi:hypothetical protein
VLAFDNGWTSLALLSQYLLDTGMDAGGIVYAMQKPYKYEDIIMALHHHTDAGQPWELIVRQVQQDYPEE